jgi:PST family polysaccharide transporter/lipopolysaccharide exporter
LTDLLRRLLRRKFVQDTLVLQVGKITASAISFISSVVVLRLLGPAGFGAWTLAQSFFIIWQTPNLTGIGPATSTRLAIAIGARNEREILNNMAFYVKVAVAWGVLNTGLLALLGPPIAANAYESGAHIGELAALLSFTLIPDALYGLAVIALQARRSMRVVAALQIVNQLTLVASYIGALLISSTVESLVIGRLVYSVTTMLIALSVYQRLRTQDGVVYPSMRAVLARALAVPVRPYWRFGVANALDKNLGGLFMEIPTQMVGILSGNAQAGYLEASFKGITLVNQLTSAVFDNMTAVVPQAVGRGDYAGLRRNFRRVLAVLIVGAVGFYGVFAIAAYFYAPLVVAPIYGAEYDPVAPLIPVVAVYGAVVTIGGIFGPLYRALRLMRRAIVVKLITLLVVFFPGIWLVQQAGALGGAWLISLMYLLSIALTAALTLPVLNQKADTTAAPAAVAGSNA